MVAVSAAPYSIDKPYDYWVPSHLEQAAVPGVRDAHRIRTRGTEGEVYADLHVLVDPAMSVADAHRLADEVEEAVRARFPNVIETLVHIEPDDGHEE